MDVPFGRATVQTVRGFGYRLADATAPLTTGCQTRALACQYPNRASGSPSSIHGHAVTV
ncbi:hypothetical protein, partial [Kitasatospora aureofaciens]|uniref:hypothetical protein n=1 Tax=Kitasatospora aureofaciens TaxID=1894 RepID=UPI003F4D6D78